MREIYPLVLTFLFVVSACKKRHFEESGVKKTRVLSSLGLNDVSVLFPALVRKTQPDGSQSQELLPTKLLTLEEKNSDGNALLSKADFEDIVSRFKATLPDGEKINSGIVFSEKPSRPPSRRAGPA